MYGCDYGGCRGNFMMQLLVHMEMIYLIYHSVTACLNNITELQHDALSISQPEIYFRALSFS